VIPNQRSSAVLPTDSQQHDSRNANLSIGHKRLRTRNVIDETRMAYKPIDAVMEARRDLVGVVQTLRQVVM
jgi:RNA-splicing ligase RtcB